MAKKALLVGINDYKGANGLRGCVNDVLDMHFSLRSLFNFQTPEIRVLTDSRATKANIIHRLKWLVHDAKAGDSLIFHFSGHGSQIRDRDGDELNDHLDEIICPYDMNWDGIFISDDELNSIFKDIPKDAGLEVFLDCCHSGTGLREMGLQPLINSDRDNFTVDDLPGAHSILNRYMPAPVDIFLRASGEQDDIGSHGFLKTFKQNNNNNNKNNSKNKILWAGCMDNQTSADAHINGRYHGAFTYYLNVHLRRNPWVPRKELLRKVRASMIHGGFSQIPQLELNAIKRDKIIFIDEKLEV